MKLYYSSPEECPKRNSSPTNLRYKKTFLQTHYTAGDEEQFFDKVDLVTKSSPRKVELWRGYCSPSADTHINTFRYLFHKFKKGVFVRIEKGQVAIFQPFSNAHFVNEWSDRLHIPGGKTEFFSKIYEAEGYCFNPRRINRNKSAWYANNALLRYEWPVHEGDTGIAAWHDMLSELCKHRRIPDCHFFLNRRDFPLITRDWTEPYDNIWDSENVSLVSHCYACYTPVLSASATSRFADILIPTPDDWTRICSSDEVAEKKYFMHGRTHPDLSQCENIPWGDKKPQAVFRGSSTGVGVSLETNMRLKLAHMALKEPDMLDAGITKWCTRPRKLKGSADLQTQDISSFEFGLTEPLSLSEQAEFKYIVHVDGHVAANRLAAELATGSVILKVDSKWKLWFSELLQPYIHYVPIKSDLSDLFEQIAWCVENDDQCQTIAQNALAFYKKKLGTKGVFDCLEKSLKTVNLVSK